MIAIINEIAPEMLNHLNNGSTGEDFGDWLVGRYGTMGMGVARGLGKEAIINYAKSTPALWQQIAPIEARFAAFVDEFLAWTPADEDEDEDETPPPIPEAKARKRKEATA